MSYKYTPKRPSRETSIIADILLVVALLIVAAVCLLPAAGCGTYGVRLSDFPSTRYYPATTFDVGTLGEVVSAPFSLDKGTADDKQGAATMLMLSPIILPLSIIDLPFSLATDTLLLPYDFYKNNTTKGDTHERHAD